MTEALRHRIQAFEEVPPDAVWQKLDQQLDAVRSELPLADRMYNVEIAPPEASWQAITIGLDSTETVGLSEKFAAYEVTPPSSVWDSVSAALSADSSADFSQRMLVHEVTPPPAVWERIQQSLGEEIPAGKELAPVRKLQPWTRRFAVAASIAGLIVLGIYYMNNKVAVVDNLSTTINSAAASNSQDSSLRSLPAPNTIPLETVVNAPGLVVTDVAPAGKKDEVVLPSRKDSRLIKYANVSSMPASHETNFIINSSPINEGRVLHQVGTTATNPGYVVVTLPDGNIIHISPKFAEAVRHLYSVNEGVDATEWNKRLKDWNNRINKSSFVPASSNLFGIIELGELISNNQ